MPHPPAGFRAERTYRKASFTALCHGVLILQKALRLCRAFLWHLRSVLFALDMSPGVRTRDRVEGHSPEPRALLSNALHHSAFPARSLVTEVIGDPPEPTHLLFRSTWANLHRASVRKRRPDFHPPAPGCKVRSLAIEPGGALSITYPPLPHPSHCPGRKTKVQILR